MCLAKQWLARILPPQGILHCERSSRTPSSTSLLHENNCVIDITYEIIEQFGARLEFNINTELDELFEILKKIRGDAASKEMVFKKIVDEYIEQTIICKPTRKPLYLCSVVRARDLSLKIPQTPLHSHNLNQKQGVNYISKLMCNYNIIKPHLKLEMLNSEGTLYSAFTACA